MPQGKAVIGQSGGPTAVINKSLIGFIKEAMNEDFDEILGARHGIGGMLSQDFVDLSKLSETQLYGIGNAPSAALGSIRKKPTNDDIEKLISIFKQNDIRNFFYIGGNDSADTALKISEACKKLSYDLNCIAIPKTVDNDLAVTDCCPGFGSVAKYVINSTIEAALDVESMAASSTKVFILEVMGRHAGWIAASSAVAIESYPHAPDLILLPEITFKERDFLKKVKDTVASKGFCVVVASEGIKNNKGRFIAESGLKDAFGHSQLGGVAPTLANIISKKTGLKNHWAVADYLQRSARHIASGVDLDQAFAVGKHAVKYASKNMHGVMPVIKRLSNNPYKCTFAIFFKEAGSIVHL